jgi:uncharacterized protein GlcG (DUF336 family)
MKAIIRPAIGLMAASLLVSAAWAQQLPSRKVLTMQVAETIAQTAVEACHANGYNVSVLVLDDAGRMKAFLRADGAGNATPEIARMKANSVLAFGRPSGPPPNLRPGQPVPPPILPGTVNAQGGVPIKADGEMIGVIAVSGAPGGDKDAACANAALEKVADQRRPRAGNRRGPLSGGLTSRTAPSATF